jgi:hypothetical protein
LIFTFLKAKRNEGLLEVFIEGALCLSIGENGPLEQYFCASMGRKTFDEGIPLAERTKGMIHVTQLAIVKIPWASEFARLEAAQKEADR